MIKIAIIPMSYALSQSNQWNQFFDWFLFQYQEFRKIENKLIPGFTLPFF